MGSMGSLIAGMLDGLGLPATLVGDTTPYVPSTPVQIGTSRPHHSISEVGSWQALLIMFCAVLLLGWAVLMVAVLQRTRLLARRRVRRMGEAVALMAAKGDGNRDTSALTPPTSPRAASATAHRVRRDGPRRADRVT